MFARTYGDCEHSWSRVDPIQLDRGSLSYVECIGIHNAAPRSIGMRKLHGVEANRAEYGKFPSGDLGFVVIPNAVGIGIIELVDAKLGRASRAAATFSDFEIISFCAVVVERRNRTNPDLIFSAGICCIVVSLRLI